MASAEQNGRETYGVIVLSRDGTKVLLVPKGERQMLPSVDIPRWQRVAENLTAAVKNDWGEEVVCLFEPETEPPADGSFIRYQAAEHVRTRNNPRMPTYWAPVSMLSQDSLADACDYAAIKQVTAVCNGEMGAASAGPFSRFGWFSELRNWIESVVEPIGFHVNGQFQQLNASPSFSLVRFETDGPALWFKAVGEPNQKEFLITCTLAQLFPHYFPGVLATRPDLNGWLTREAAGKHLCEVGEDWLWQRAAAALAELQIDSIDHGAPILGAGARDLGATELSKLIQPFMETMLQLMSRQTTVLPPALGREELLLLGDRIQSALDTLEAQGIPETLGHLDLNPGNIIVSPSRCTFLDWAEAYVGNPFFSLEYLLEHLRRTSGTDSAVEAKLVEAYCAQWEQVVPTAAVAEGLALAPLMAVFAYAAGSNAWEDAGRLEEPTTAGYFRSLTRRMHREATELADQRSLCLH